MIKSVLLDTQKSLDPPTQTIFLRQGDIASTTLDISIYEDGDAFDMTEYEARFMAALPSGKVIIDPCHKTGANSLSYTLPTAINASVGKITLAYVAIYQGNEWVASTNCLAFQVLKGVDIKAEEAENILSEYETLKKRMEEIIAQALAQKEDQQIAWNQQMQDQQGDWLSQLEQQQSSWEAQLSDQQTEFDQKESERAEAEAARVEAEKLRNQAVADAIASLQELAIISDEEIIALWA